MAAENVPMGMLLHSVGAVQTGRNFGTVEYEIALVRPDEYNLEWWFRRLEENLAVTPGRYASRGWRTKSPSPGRLTIMPSPFSISSARAATRCETW